MSMPVTGIDRETIEAASARAKAEPLAFNPAERKSYVTSMLSRTQEYLNQGMSIDDIKARLPEFATDYKQLFETITTPGYDKKSLEIMIAMLGHMTNGKLSQHDASVIVGKRLYEKFGTKPNGETADS